MFWFVNDMIRDLSFTKGDEVRILVDMEMTNVHRKHVELGGNSTACNEIGRDCSTKQMSKHGPTVNTYTNGEQIYNANQFAHGDEL